MSETWKRVPEFENYEVSSLGRVRRLTSATSTKAGRILRATLHYRGYLHHGLCVKGRLITVRLNRLVCLVFHGPAPSKEHQAAHRDGNPLNNAADNLRWATKLENEADKDRHGTRRRGAAIRTAKLTEEIVAEIKRRSAIGRVSPTLLSKEFGAPIGAISQVIHGRSWKHVRIGGA